jgi:hypothetical protein
MTLTTDGILNVDISGATINVNISGQTLTFAQTGDGTIRTGSVAITTASGGTQLPNVSVRQGVRFFPVGNNGAIYFGGLSGDAPWYDGGLVPYQNGIANPDSEMLSKVKNLNTLRVVSTVSNYYLGYFGID